jgi:hypothetical protein
LARISLQKPPRKLDTLSAQDKLAVADAARKYVGN